MAQENRSQTCSAVSLLDVVLMKPHSMKPRRPKSSTLVKDSGSSLAPKPLYSFKPDCNLTVRDSFTVAETKTWMVVEKKLPLALNASKR